MTSPIRDSWTSPDGAVTLLLGDCIDRLRDLTDESVHCCVTSPPYWGLRDYGVDGQIGLEKTPEEFVAKMVAVFREVRRVLRDDGTCWVNLGDSYASTPAGRMTTSGSLEGGGFRSNKPFNTADTQVTGLKQKDLCGIPWRVAFALQADGWYLRSDIIWHKPNPMPESVTDRPTKAHEYLFLLTKSARYFYDAEAIKEDVAGTAHPRANGKNSRMVKERAVGREDSKPNPSRSAIPGIGQKAAAAGSGIKANDSFMSQVTQTVSARNRRSVWTIATHAYPEAHFATYPPALVEPCVKAGTSEKGCCAKCGAPWERMTAKESVLPVDYEGKNLSTDRQSSARRMLANTRARRMNGGAHDNPFPGAVTTGWQPTCDCNAETVPCIVLDPFAGSGTTLQVARLLGRNAIGVELSPQYAELAKVRAMSNLERNDDSRPLFEQKPLRQRELAVVSA